MGGPDRLEASFGADPLDRFLEGHLRDLGIEVAVGCLVLEGDVEGLVAGHLVAPHQSTSQKSLETASLMVGVM